MLLSKRRKSHFRDSRFQNFPRGACPRTPPGNLAPSALACASVRKTARSAPAWSSTGCHFLITETLSMSVGRHNGFTLPENLTYTVINPRTMMIHSSYAAITDGTMFRTDWTPYLKRSNRSIDIKTCPYKSVISQIRIFVW